MIRFRDDAALDDYIENQKESDITERFHEITDEEIEQAIAVANYTNALFKEVLKGFEF